MEIHSISPCFPSSFRFFCFKESEETHLPLLKKTRKPFPWATFQWNGTAVVPRFSVFQLTTLEVGMEKMDQGWRIIPVTHF